ncbi:anti-sigma factor [Mycolicibacterium sp. CH28]|uniref:anti-sigma factor n=1 Tax=Mycolicibacterium sp. CH28 TaxID=2512237 RepID=UPI001081C055|nr:anti-sigma factor [Mycolicibacterium sp. CH28]TGD87420.1 anti-sigma factor [Mycolicibacterium sp. CH28]
MTQQLDGSESGDLLELAVPYALHAVSDSEREQIETQLAHAGRQAADAFYDEVRAVRETMAVVSSASAAEPPAALRQRLLTAVADDNVRTLPTAHPEPANRRWRTAVLSAVAALVVGLGAVGVVLSLRPEAAQPSTAQQVFAAPDVHTVSGAIPGGGTATVVFSREKNAGVLVMNDVPKPVPGTVYQMWLVSDSGQTSAGTMDDKAVTPSTTAVLPDLGNSKALKFTVEPGTGSTEPTGQVVAELPLS